MIFTAPCQTAAEERRASIVRRVASPRAVRHHLVCFGALLNFDQNLLLLPLQLRALPFEVAHRFVYHSLVLAELLCAVDAYQRRGIASAVRREIAYPAVSSSCRITTPFLKRHPRPEAKNTALGTVTWMKDSLACHPELRCVKTRRIGSCSNLYTHACQLLRLLPALSYEPTLCRARPFVSV